MSAPACACAYSDLVEGMGAVTDVGETLMASMHHVVDRAPRFERVKTDYADVPRSINRYLTRPWEVELPVQDRLDDDSRGHRGAALAARLRRLSERIDRDGARVYAAHGIRFEQRWYGVLRLIRANGAMSVMQIADALQISHASVSEARRSLEKANIISSVSAADDRRKRTLELTTTGIELCDRLAPLWEQFNATAAELNAEAGDVVDLLDRLDDALARRSMFDRIMERSMGTTPPSSDR